MNIFYLDTDTKLCAQYHYDKHVVKMILESAQLLSTAIRELHGKETLIIFPNKKKKKVKLLPNETYHIIEKTVHKKGISKIVYQLVLSTGIYVSTHVNHPCAKWVRESIENWTYTYKLMLDLEAEWQYRFDKKLRHKSVNQLLNAGLVDYAKNCLPKKAGTKVGLAMPDEYKTGSPVDSYRNYYKFGKIDLVKYTKREKPNWL